MSEKERIILIPHSEEDKKRFIMNVAKGSKEWQERKKAAEMKNQEKLGEV